MEKLMQKENVYVGYGSSPKTPESEAMNFKDVFGGPPRRFSMQEVRERYSFGESSSDAAAWEKPVFGEEKRRQKGADFFDDIFKGSPRRNDRDSDVFGSNPASRIMSPATRPFSPKPDPLASSLPALFSLPAKWTKSMDLPTFGSHNYGQHKVDEGSNGLSSPHSSSPFSRFSNEASQSFDDMIRNEVQPVSRHWPLSSEAEDSPFNAISDQKDIIENSNKDMRNVDNIGNQFHFSIYKWAGRGVPMLIPNLKSKDSIKYEKSASSNGRMESKSSSFRKQGSSAAELEPLRSELAEGDVKSKGEEKQEQNHVLEALFELSKSKSQGSRNDSVASDRNLKEERVKSVDRRSNAGDKIVKEVPVKISEGLNSQLKPLHAFLDERDQPVFVEEMKDMKARAPLVRGDAHDSKKVKEKGRKGLDLDNAKSEKSNLQGVATNSGAAQGKSAAAKGKVKEFVQIFNQDADSRPKGNEVSSNQEKVNEQVNLENVDKKPDVSFKEVENLKANDAQQFSPRRTSTSSRSSSRLRKSFSAGMLREDFKMSQEKLDDPFEDNFEVHELSDGNENVTQHESSEEMKAIDAKIRQWSVGKKGNIRSLLSTLQYVLWPESGWKAVPLVDLIESNAVKRAYQKALLRLHPDKLQQKGAAFHHKYTAEKVFDILQEAWDHFNTCSSLGI